MWDNSCIKIDKQVLKKIKSKEVIKVVLLDDLKQALSAYEEPLKDLRDSL